MQLYVVIFWFFPIHHWAKSFACAKGTFIHTWAQERSFQHFSVAVLSHSPASLALGDASKADFLWRGFLGAKDEAGGRKLENSAAQQIPVYAI